MTPFAKKDKIKMPLDEKEWKKRLTGEQFRVLRENGTEAPFTGKFVHTKEKGMYICAACGTELFDSNAKFDSGTGWPSFDNPADVKNIELKEDNSRFMRRVEVNCKTCGSHLGHVFEDGPTKTRKRFCINSCSLDFNKK